MHVTVGFSFFSGSSENDENNEFDGFESEHHLRPLQGLPHRPRDGRRVRSFL